MRILICSFEYPPHGSGIANVAYNLRLSFEELGHKVSVCSPDGPEVRIGDWANIERLGGLGIISFWRKTQRYIEKNIGRYDVVLLENPLLPRKIYSPNIFITTHTTYYEFWNQVKEKGNKGSFERAYYYSMKKYEAMCYRKLDKRIRFTSASDVVTEEEILKLGVPEKNVRFISNGADTRRFKPADNKKKMALRKKYGLDLRKDIITFVGRLEYQHRILEMLRMFRKVKQKKQDIQLVIVGSGSYEKKMKDLVSEEKMQDVIFIPKIEYKLLHEIYQASDYFMLNSLYTGQSLALLEAFSTGCLLLVPNIISFRQLINDCKTGCLYHPEDESRAAKQILKYISTVDKDKDRKKQRIYAENKVSWLAQAKKYLGYFNEYRNKK